jgi:hypothetical protein
MKNMGMEEGEIEDCVKERRKGKDVWGIKKGRYLTKKEESKMGIERAGRNEREK